MKDIMDTNEDESPINISLKEVFNLNPLKKRLSL